MPEPLMNINRTGALLQCRDCFMCACVVQATLGPSGAVFYLLGAIRFGRVLVDNGDCARIAHSSNQAATRSNLIGSRPVTFVRRRVFLPDFSADIFLLDILTPLRGAPA
jgi:hypothetical protein